ncbi:heavy-metal-associated domain-containing protein [Salinicoccus halodurans]|uniref:Copper chaperone CopZ n=1 Tax=Salinicoccus halodurans TaxID=407035 RepID=A0A0F7HJ16_9STAP|nr:heavy-metal-associated domain-containing protein [Salinicoccus halodurans]AKG73048.1 heavy metal-binding protein [Salinicoccus halodurans]SFK78044.1 Copper chaperone CopZ [Salinicoccus halodurans]
MKTNLQTETFTCPSCIKKIERNLNSQEGVDAAKVLFNSSKVKVEHDENQINAEEIKGIVEKLGYPVLDIKSR